MGDLASLFRSTLVCAATAADQPAQLRCAVKRGEAVYTAPMWHRLRLSQRGHNAIAAGRRWAGWAREARSPPDEEQRRWRRPKDTADVCVPRPRCVVSLRAEGGEGIVVCCTDALDAGQQARAHAKKGQGTSVGAYALRRRTSAAISAAARGGGDGTGTALQRWQRLPHLKEAEEEADVAAAAAAAAAAANQRTSPSHITSLTLHPCTPTNTPHLSPPSPLPLLPFTFSLNTFSAPANEFPVVGRSLPSVLFSDVV